MGQTADDVIVSGTVTVPDSASETEIRKACSIEAARIISEDPERFFRSNPISTWDAR